MSATMAPMTTAAHDHRLAHLSDDALVRARVKLEALGRHPSPNETPCLSCGTALSHHWFRARRFPVSSYNWTKRFVCSTCREAR